MVGLELVYYGKVIELILSSVVHWTPRRTHNLEASVSVNHKETIILSKSTGVQIFLIYGARLNSKL